MDHDRYFFALDWKERNAYVSSVSWFDIYFYMTSVGKTSKDILTQISNLVAAGEVSFIIELAMKRKTMDPVSYDIIERKNYWKWRNPKQACIPAKITIYFFESRSSLYRFDLCGKSD